MDNPLATKAHANLNQIPTHMSVLSLFNSYFNETRLKFFGWLFRSIHPMCLRIDNQRIPGSLRKLIIQPSIKPIFL
jgi:hypothetical protein